MKKLSLFLLLGFTLSINSFVLAQQADNNKEIINQSPLQIALGAMDESFSEATNFKITQEASAESPTTAIITIVETHLLDDSLEAIMTKFHLTKKNENWVIKKKSVLWKCKPNRGSQNFTTKLCN
ncbi:hypothetical protein EKN56_11130 [Limnobaculum zhutongyuii]|uniref:Uncharacterized protein n=1 Tax=Limnobaculum zhutongyuii TaxID=2498113 RepID=A0A411WL47_9GAMM|nr:hypothetical protein [Limnobaculum zhutongyuii]QBH96902.1 hypothetical protein EKN56_11130 [Limnobaculum zhutongyuii]TQS87006.1 hypothetical protein ELQ32_16445 [Limnobaculum zhutongyuii]